MRWAGWAESVLPGGVQSCGARGSSSSVGSRAAGLQAFHGALPPRLLRPGCGSVMESSNKEAECTVCSLLTSGLLRPPLPVGTLWSPPPETTWPALSMPSCQGPDSDGEPGLACREDQLTAVFSGLARASLEEGVPAYSCLSAPDSGATGRSTAFRASVWGM